MALYMMELLQKKGMPFVGKRKLLEIVALNKISQFLRAKCYVFSHMCDLDLGKGLEEEGRGKEGGLGGIVMIKVC